MGDINLVAVLVAAVASFAIGSAWYSPLLFGKMWMRLQKRSQEEMKNGMRAAMIVGVATALLASFVLAHFIAAQEAASIGGGLVVAFWAWLGFIVPVSLMNIAYEGQKREVALIFLGYELVSFLVMGGILAGWS